MQDTESSSSNITATSEQEETDWQSHPTTLSLPSRKRKRNANAFREDMLALEKQKLLLIQRRLNESEANEELKQDEDYLFLMSILPAMKKLSAIQKLHLRGKINDWLVEEAMTVKETGFSYTPGQYQHQVGPKYALDDNDYSDDEIVPSAIVEPILLKPDSAEDEEIVLDLKPEPYLDSHPGRTHMEPYSSQDQSWSSDMARRTIQQLNLRAAEFRLAAVQARRRTQRLLGAAGIHKTRSHMVAFQHQRYTAKYGFFAAKYGLRRM